MNYSYCEIIMCPTSIIIYPQRRIQSSHKFQLHCQNIQYECGKIRLVVKKLQQLLSHRREGQEKVMKIEDFDSPKLL